MVSAWVSCAAQVSQESWLGLAVCQNSNKIHSMREVAAVSNWVQHFWYTTLAPHLVKWSKNMMKKINSGMEASLARSCWIGSAEHHKQMIFFRRDHLVQRSRSWCRRPGSWRDTVDTSIQRFNMQSRFHTHSLRGRHTRALLVPRWPRLATAMIWTRWLLWWRALGMMWTTAGCSMSIPPQKRMISFTRISCNTLSAFNTHAFTHWESSNRILIYIEACHCGVHDVFQQQKRQSQR